MLSRIIRTLIQCFVFIKIEASSQQYCLVQLYAVTKSNLVLIKPLAKFLTFKLIIFLTWWQGLAVAFLFSMGAFKGALAQELKTRIQDYIICIEVCTVMILISKLFPLLWFGLFMRM